MVSFGEKEKKKNAGNLNQGRSYVITTVHKCLNIKESSLEKVTYYLEIV
jgi:hypothetical protein